jgi:hypothetical protein
MQIHVDARLRVAEKRHHGVNWKKAAAFVW